MIHLRNEESKWTEKFKRGEERKEKGIPLRAVFYLVFDDGVEVVDVHGLPAQLTSWLQGRR